MHGTKNMPVIDGKRIAKEIKERLKEQFGSLKDLRKFEAKLGSITIGKDPSSKIYVDSQKKLCDEFGIEYILREEPENTSMERIDQVIAEFKNQNVTGIIVQLPLPEGINHQYITECIGPDLDVEGLHPANIGRFFSGNYNLAPCTPAAVMEILKYIKVQLRGKEVVIIGHSEIVGKPLSIMLLNEFATVTVCHIATSERGLLEKHVREAEILISAVGVEGFRIPGEWIKEDAIVIDIATKGDVDFESAKKKASYITPVPGGVGPVTNVMLMKNFLELYRR